MTKQMERRRRRGFSPLANSIFTPWSNSFVRPWGRDIFPSTNLRALNNLIRFHDSYKDDFTEDGGLMPAINVKERKLNFEIEFAAPGFNKKDFEVSIEEYMLHVCGEKEAEDDENEDNYSRKEFCYKSFKRSVMLPSSVDLDQNVKASYKNGILKVKLFKKEEAPKNKTSKKVIEVD